MIKLDPKCQTYNEYVANAANLLKYKMLIVVAPTIILALLCIIICILTASFYPLIIAFVSLCYCLSINKILGNKFDSLNREILRCYIMHYDYDKNNSTRAALIEDNKMIYTKINIAEETNNLSCWKVNEELHYISADFMTIIELTYAKTSYEEYRKLIHKDFGMLIISINSVDHYRDNHLICTMKDSVLKMKFSNEKALDLYIPTKEYYYNSNKKENSKA